MNCFDFQPSKVKDIRLIQGYNDKLLCIKSKDEFYLRSLVNSVIKLGKAVLTPLNFNHLN